MLRWRISHARQRLTRIIRQFNFFLRNPSLFTRTATNVKICQRNKTYGNEIICWFDWPENSITSNYSYTRRQDKQPTRDPEFEELTEKNQLDFERFSVKTNINKVIFRMNLSRPTRDQNKPYSYHSRPWDWHPSQVYVEVDRFWNAHFQM